MTCYSNCVELTHLYKLSAPFCVGQSVSATSKTRSALVFLLFFGDNLRKILWMCPKELKLKVNEYFCCINADRTPLGSCTYKYFQLCPAFSGQLLSSLGVPITQNDKKSQALIHQAQHEAHKAANLSEENVCVSLGCSDAGRRQCRCLRVKRQ